MTVTGVDFQLKVVTGMAVTVPLLAFCFVPRTLRLFAYHGSPRLWLCEVAGQLHKGEMVEELARESAQLYATKTS